MTYFLNVVAFLSVVVGVFGKTHDETARGFRKILPLGWAAILLGFAVLAVSSLSAHRQCEKIAAAEQEVQKQKIDAAEIIRNALTRTLDGLDIIYRDCLGVLSFDLLSDLEDPLFLNCLSSTDISKPVNDVNFVGVTDPMNKLIQGITRERLGAYGSRLDFYRSLLPPDLLTKLRAYPENRGFSLLDNADIHNWANSDLSNPDGKRYPHYIIPPDDLEFFTEAYLEMIKSARSLDSEISLWEKALKESRSSSCFW